MATYSGKTEQFAGPSDERSRRNDLQRDNIVSQGAETPNALAGNPALVAKDGRRRYAGLRGAETLFEAIRNAGRTRLYHRIFESRVTTSRSPWEQRTDRLQRNIATSYAREIPGKPGQDEAIRGHSTTRHKAFLCDIGVTLIGRTQRTNAALSTARQNYECCTTLSAGDTAGRPAPTTFDKPRA